MRIYKNIREAIGGTIKEVLTKGEKTPAGEWQAVTFFEKEPMSVIYNWVFQVEVPSTKSGLMEQTACDKPWAEDHFKERIEGVPTNPGLTYRYWPYNTFKESGDPFMERDKFSHTYQERFWPKRAGDMSHTGYPLVGIRYVYGDLEDVITKLKQNPYTRQAYLPIFFPEDTGATSRRVPCTIGYYFYKQGGKLHINYTIRSCDIYRHFRNDIYLTGRLLQYVAKRTGNMVGNMLFVGFNLHLFENNRYPLTKREEKINKAHAGKL